MPLDKRGNVKAKVYTRKKGKRMNLVTNGKAKLVTDGNSAQETIGRQQTEGKSTNQLVYRKEVATTLTQQDLGTINICRLDEVATDDRQKDFASGKNDRTSARREKNIDLKMGKRKVVKKFEEKKRLWESFQPLKC